MIKLSPIGFIPPFSAISAPAADLKRPTTVRLHMVCKYRLIPPRREQPLNAGMALTAEANVAAGCGPGMGRNEVVFNTIGDPFRLRPHPQLVIERLD